MSGRRRISLDQLGAEIWLEQQQAERRPTSKQPGKRRGRGKRPERTFTPKRSSSPPHPAVCWRCQAAPPRPGGPSCSACFAHIQRRGAELRARFEAPQRWRERDAR